MSEGLKVARIDHAGDDREIIAVYTYTGDDVDIDVVASLDPLDQWKQPVRVATTGAITIASGLNAGDTIDGVTLVAGDRVLVKDQAAPEENGIWVVDATPFRAPDMDEDDEVLGAIVYVIAGTANAGTLWSATNLTAPDIGTDAIPWAEIVGGVGGGPDTTLNTVASSGSTETLDVSAARTHDVTLDDNCTLTFTGAVTSEAWWFSLRLEGTDTYSVTWPGSVSWPGASGAPTLSGPVDWFTFVTRDGGTSWEGWHAGATPFAVLDDIPDVAAPSPTDGQVLTWDTGTAAWIAADPAPGGASATDANIWRPLMDGAGAVITDSGTGEAIMAFGPA